MSRPGGPLLVASLLSAVAGAFLWLSLSGGSGGGQTNTPPRDGAPSGGSVSAAAVHATGPEQVATELYAVEVDGIALRSGARPGSELELWVLWDHPGPKRPRREKLLPRVTLDEVIPAFTPGGPDAAVLRVEVADIPELLRAERRGVLEVRIPDPPPRE